ncbi:MAG TPA: surface-adhesin E family protein [Steroidobacteraceae bacterium]|nr:surface-adhesin E family protein [Steroidobacteraceae bacterium]
MRAMIVLSAAMAAIAATPSFAAQWLSVWRDFDSADQHKYEVLLDLSSIRVKAAQPNTRIASVKYVRTRPHSNGNANDGVAYSITEKSFDCDKRRTRLDHSEAHFSDGTLQFVDPPKDKSIWHAVKDPAARQILNIVCEAQNPKTEDAAPNGHFGS